MKNKTLAKKLTAWGLMTAMTVSACYVPDVDMTVHAEDLENVFYSNAEKKTQEEIAFITEDWDEKIVFSYDEGVQDVKTTANFKVTADVYLDKTAYDSLAADADDTEGEEDYLKIQSVVKINDNDWTWTQSEDIKYMTQSSFVQVDDTEEYKSSIEITYSDVSVDTLKGVYFVMVGSEFMGSVSYANVTISEVASANQELEKKEPTTVDDFENEEAVTWVEDAGYAYEGGVSIAKENINGSQQMKVTLDYTGEAENTWSEAKIKKFFAEGIDISAYNRLTYELTYPKACAGNFKAKVYAKNQTEDVDTELINKYTGILETEDIGNDLVKSVVEVSFSPNEKSVTELTLSIIGVNTEFKGDIYMDNIVFSQYDASADYVEITEVVKEAASADVSHMPDTVALADGKATKEAVALYAYLEGLTASNQVVFGHQNDTHKHVGTNDGVYSDTKDVTGSISGVVGIDSLALTGTELGIDTVDAAIAEAVNISKNAAAEGAIITLSTHMPNMSDEKIVATPDGTRKYNFSACDFAESKNLANNCAKEVLPGGAYHAQFTCYLDIIADYALALQEENIPVMFRPYHENTGGWFWWGAATTDVETYNALWRYTVDYLTNERNVHNLLYIYSPNGPLTSTEEYAKRYPGNDYVDIVAFDYYNDYNTYPAEWSEDFMTSLNTTCEVVKDFAAENHKVAAIGETGVRVMKKDGSDNEGILVKDNPIKNQNWYSRVQAIAKAQDMSYFLLWANFSETNFYVPYKVEDKGHELINEFIAFYNEDSSIFANGTNFYNEAVTAEVTNTKESRPSGYFTNVFSKDVIKENTMISANVKNAQNVEFILANGEVTQTLKTQEKEGTYTATVTAEDLTKVGLTDIGTISLAADGETLVTLTFISFGKDKDILPENMVENFELYYGDNDYLSGTFSENSAANCTSSFVLDSENKASGSYGGAFNYQLKTSGAEVWTGRMKGLEATDYSKYNALSMWVKPDGKGQKLVIQLVSGGEDFEVFLTDFVKTTEAKYITIPFEALKGKQNGKFNSADITKFAVWCNSIPANGETDIASAIVFDDIFFVNVDTSALQVENGYAITDTPVGSEKNEQDKEDKEEIEKTEEEKTEDVKTEDVKQEETKAVSYNITYVLNQGTNHKDNPAVYTKETVTLKNPGRRGYAFEGWYTDAAFTSQVTQIEPSMAKDITLYAKWSKITVKKAKLQTVKNTKKKAMQVKIKKVSKADGYEIVYSTNKKFKKSKKVTTAKTKTLVKKLKKGKTYYVKVRAYQKDSVNKKVYGKYSKCKQVKIRK
ncbi:MAG: InlB B-repeat-containing protein [Lachnospiraceae bacterium]|nr:InlB B-repeat-containing protein [Lachnospiraceae bacterium]